MKSRSEENNLVPKLEDTRMSYLKKIGYPHKILWVSHRYSNKLYLKYC
jgi:hypothetical protein